MDLVELIPTFGNFAFTLGAFVVALLVIVAVHEYGHYIVGRWTGIQAEVFSIGFGPVIWSRHEKRGTRWQIAAIPLGGYVRFFGDSDELPIEPGLEYEVRRGERVVTVPGPHPYPAMVSAVSPDSAAADARVRVGDVILSINEASIHAFSELQDAVAAAEGAAVNLTIWRDGSELQLSLTPRRTDLPLPDGGFETRWLIGISGGVWFEPETATPGLLESLRFGTDQTIFVVRASISGLYHMIAGRISSCNLRGPIGIAQTSGTVAAQGLFAFIGFIALLSTAVGLLNLFPIPVLNGGHLAFFAYEAISGRPPSPGALRIIMTLGLALIASLMLFALSNDLFCP